MNNLNQKNKIYILLERYGTKEDLEYFCNLAGIQVKNQSNNYTISYQEKPCPNCKKMVLPTDIFCLEDLGMVGCTYCADTIE